MWLVLGGSSSRWKIQHWRQGWSDEILTRAEVTAGESGVSLGWFGLLSSLCFLEFWNSVWVIQHLVFPGILFGLLSSLFFQESWKTVGVIQLFVFSGILEFCLGYSALGVPWNSGILFGLFSTSCFLEFCLGYSALWVPWNSVWVIQLSVFPGILELFGLLSSWYSRSSAKLVQLQSSVFVLLEVSFVSHQT